MSRRDEIMKLVDEARALAFKTPCPAGVGECFDIATRAIAAWRPSGADAATQLSIVGSRLFAASLLLYEARRVEFEPAIETLLEVCAEILGAEGAAGRSIPSVVDATPVVADRTPVATLSTPSEQVGAPALPTRPTAEPELAAPRGVVAEVDASPSPPELSVEACAALAASVARENTRRTQILAGSGLTEATWKALHEGWAGRIQAEVEKGKGDLLSTYDSAYVAQLAKERGPITAGEYARIVVAAERNSGDDAMQTMGLPSEASARIRRVWIAKMAKDTAQGALARKAIEAERAR